jgi:hypothetical protein
MYTGSTPEVHATIRCSSDDHPVYIRCTSGVHSIRVALARLGWPKTAGVPAAWRTVKAV